MLFSAFAENWLEEVSHRYVYASYAKYREILETAIVPVLGNRKTEEVDETCIKKLVISLQDEGKGASRIQSVISVLNLILEYAVNKNILIRNPCKLVSIRKRIRKNAEILNDRDILTMVREFEDHKYMPMILCMLFLGLSVGEAMGLKWDYVDLKNATIAVREKLSTYYIDGRTEWSLVPVKRERILPLCQQAKACLEKQRALGPADTILVFTEPDGSMIKYAAFYYEFNKIMKAIGRPYVTPQGLRQTAAATMLYTTGDIVLIKEYLGYRSVRSAKRYTPVTEHEKRRVAGMLNAYFRPYLERIFTEEENIYAGYDLHNGG